MKLCNKCNNKRGGITRFALVETGILKLVFLCQNCKHQIRATKVPMIQIPNDGIDIKQVIAQMNVEYEKQTKQPETLPNN